MTDSTIMLAVSTDFSKITYPVQVSVKLDGTAADFYCKDGKWNVRTRQNEPLPSCEHIVKFLNGAFANAVDGLHVIGELTVMGVDTFKEGSGIVRRKEVDTRIMLNVYDCYLEGQEYEQFEKRNTRVEYFVKKANEKREVRFRDGNVSWSVIHQVPVHGEAPNAKALSLILESMDYLFDQSGIYEGYMIRCLRGADSKYGVNKRSRGMMRYKPKPTVDLRIVSFEEATANKEMQFLGETYQKGEGLGAVGRINVAYKDMVVGVGAGTLSHKERRALWNWYKDGGLLSELPLAEVEYMRDASYEALRQPVFKRWRTDKTEVNECG